MEQPQALPATDYFDQGMQVGKLDIKILKSVCIFDAEQAKKDIQEKEAIEWPIINSFLNNSKPGESEIAQQRAFLGGYLKRLEDFNINEWTRTMKNQSSAASMQENYTTLVGFITVSLKALADKNFEEYKAIQLKKRTDEIAKKIVLQNAPSLTKGLDEQYQPTIDALDKINADLQKLVTKPGNQIVRCAECKVPQTPSRQLLNCSGCRSVLYCSKECQLKNWKAGHKIECKKKQAAQTSVP